MEVLGSCHSHYWGNLKILLSYADPSHPTYANVNFMSKSQAHMQLIVGSHYFLYMYVAYELVRPWGHEPHQSLQCNPNHCHKNTMWNLQRVLIIKINWIKLNQDTKEQSTLKCGQYLSEYWICCGTLGNAGLAGLIMSYDITLPNNVTTIFICWLIVLPKHWNLSWNILLHMPWPSTTNVIATLFQANSFATLISILSIQCIT